MGRIPEQRDGLFEYKAPKYRPIQSGENTCHGNRGGKRFDRAATIPDYECLLFLCNVMNTGANIEFIVTEIASATRNLARQKSPVHQCGGIFQTHIFQENGSAF